MGAGREPAVGGVHPAQGHHVPREAGRHAEPRAHGRGRGLLLQPAALEPQEARRPTTTSWAMSWPRTSTPSSSTSRNTPPSGTTGWPGASTRVIMPKEVADAGATNWKNVNGTGPFMLTDFVAGNSNTYTKNPIYWDKEKIGGAGLQAAVRRQADLSHHQGRGDPACRDPHRQARPPGIDQCALRAGAEEERAAAPMGQASVDPRARSWRCATT